MKGFLLFTLGAGIGYCAAYYRKELTEFVKSQLNLWRHKSEQEAHNETITNEDKVYDIVLAKEEFRNMVDKFSGIYESLYLVSIGKISDGTDVMNDWNARVRFLKKSPHFQQFWDQSKSDLKSVMSFFSACGLQRDERKQFIADDKTRYQYVLLSEGPIEIGNEYEVFFPCWTFSEKIIEKGTLKIK